MAETTWAAKAQLLPSLLDEALASCSRGEQLALFRAALPEAFTADLVAALLDGDDAADVARTATHFALAADLCRHSARFAGDWLEFHPLFREGLRERLEGEETPAAIADLHARAAQWFTAASLPDAAINHWVAAGQIDTAQAMVEREIQPAFDREDWPSVARWLALLPEETIREQLPLLLARGWLAHLRGTPAHLKTTLQLIDEYLARGDLPDAARAAARAELDLMLLGTMLPLQIDPRQTLTTAQAAVANVSPSRRFQLGIAWSLYGMALQANGQGDTAVAQLTEWADAADRVDAGSIRARFALLFVYWQAGNLARVQSMARTTHEVASRHRLRLVAGWGHRFHGDVLYERNDLAGAIEHYAIVVGDYEYFHLTGLREALVGLALTYLAAGRLAESSRALRRTREILVDAGALEHLPVLDAYEAYVALLAGDLPRALEWVRANAVDVESATLFVLVHPVVIRAAIFCAAGDEASLAEAVALLEEVRRRAVRANFIGPMVRVDALLAIAHLKRGQRDAAVAAMRRSLATGLPQGYVRTYLDLLPMFARELRQLAPEVDLPPALRAALELSPAPIDTRAAPSERSSPIALLTEREHDVLAALDQRLSYKEAADQLFIAPATVKRHASSIYSKLGVTGRTEAIRAARKLGWQPLRTG
jgi:LuxR family maltose regulon positive regulatory protein